MNIGSAAIKDTKTNNLQISEDTGRDSDDFTAVLLYTPNMNDTSEHFHIELGLEEVAKLYAWLGRFLQTRGKDGKA